VGQPDHKETAVSDARGSIIALDELARTATTLWVEATAPLVYEAFVAHVDASVATLRAR
jgi:hypothetical protein